MAAKRDHILNAFLTSDRKLWLISLCAMVFCLLYPYRPSAQTIYPMYHPCRCETGQWGYVGNEDEWTIQPLYDAVLYETNGGMYPVSTNGKWGFVGISGEPLTDISYDAAVCEIDYLKNNYSFYYAALRKKGKWAFIDVSGRFITDFKYDEVLIMNGKYIIRIREGKRMRSGYLTEGGIEVWNE